MTQALPISESPQQTEQTAAELAARLRPGDVVLVSGELGSGKTTLLNTLLGLGLVTALYSGAERCAVELQVRFEDGRTGVVRAELPIDNARTFTRQELAQAA